MKDEASNTAQNQKQLHSWICRYLQSCQTLYSLGSVITASQGLSSVLEATALDGKKENRMAGAGEGGMKEKVNTQTYMAEAGLVSSPHWLSMFTGIILFDDKEMQQIPAKRRGA